MTLQLFKSFAKNGLKDQSLIDLKGRWIESEHGQLLPQSDGVAELTVTYLQHILFGLNIVLHVRLHVLGLSTINQGNHPI